MADLKLALRTLARTPFVSSVAILSLALGIGANAAIFSLFEQMLLRPLPVEAPERLVNLAAPGPKPGSQSCNQAGDCDVVFSYPMFRDLQAENPAGFAGFAAHRAFGANLATGERTRNGEGMMVSGSYFPLLGVQPAMGRLLSPADDGNPGEHPVAVLSHRFWESALGSDAGVLNRAIEINGRSMTIVGVAPPGFEGTTLGARPDVFVPLSMRAAIEPRVDEVIFDNRRSYWVYVFGRLAPGATIESAASAVNGVYRPIINDVEAPLQEGMSAATLERFRAKQVVLEEGARGQSSVDAEAREPLMWLFAVTAAVLLIACANIANLLLARGANRSQEMGIRNSLGAGRVALLRQLLTESVLLAALGGLASLLVARWTLGVLAAILPAEVAAVLELELGGGVVAFTAVVALLTGLLFGLYPALHATRTDLVTVLKSSSGQPSGARAAARFRSALVMAQIALSTTLLVAAGLFVRSLMEVGRVDLGLNTDNVVTFAISPALNGYEPERNMALFTRVEERLAALPGVRAVSAALVPVLAGSNWGSDVQVEGFERGPDVDANARFNLVGPGYFATLGIPLLAGRGFTTADVEGAPPVAIVNETFAEKFGLGRDAVGKWMSHGGSDELDTRIVGLVQDAKYADVKQDVPPMFFTPYRQDAGIGFLTFYARTAGDPAQVLRAVPGVIEQLDPSLPVEELKTLEQQVRDNVFIDRVISMLAAAFAVLATLLAAVGLYGVLAYTVAQRTREIGLRMALGAEAGRVRAMVLWHVARMLAVGAFVGVLGALAVGRAARSLLFGLEGDDPLVIALSVALLTAVALGAALLPAARAARVDPMQALRYE